MNRGRGIRRNRGRTTNQQFKAFERHVERALLSVPHEFTPPIHIPRLHFDVKVNRIIPVHIFYTTGTTQFVYGSVSEPTRHYLAGASLGTSATQVIKQFIVGAYTMREIGRMAVSSMFRASDLVNAFTGTTGGIDVSNFSLFSTIQINKITLWGPVSGGVFAGAPIELHVSKSLSKSTGGTSDITGYVVGQSDGDRTARSRVGFSMENPQNYIYSEGDVSDGPNIRGIVIQIGDYGTTLPIVKGSSTAEVAELIGVMHISFTGTISSVNTNVNFEDDLSDDIEVVSEISTNSLPFRRQRTGVAKPAPSVRR